MVNTQDLIPDHVRERAADPLVPPRLSVVIPNYNHANYLAKAVGAILTQSYEPLEIIVIDDCSTDRSLQVIESLATHYSRLRVLRNHRNCGPIPTVMRGFRESRGDYVYSGAADDEVLPGFFAKSMDLVRRFPEAGLCSTLSYVTDEGGNRRGTLPPYAPLASPGYISRARALSLLEHQGNWMQGNTCIFRKDALFQVGGFLPELGPFADGFTHLVLALRYGVCFVPEPLASWRQSDSGYAMSAVTQPSSAMHLWSTAATLMRTTFRDIFPARFVDQWEEEKLCRTALDVVARRHRDSLAVLDLLSGAKGARQGSVDRATRGLIRGLSVIESAIVAGYAARHHWPGMYASALRIVRRRLAQLR